MSQPQDVEVERNLKELAKNLIIYIGGVGLTYITGNIITQQEIFGFIAAFIVVIAILLYFFITKKFQAIIAIRDATIEELQGDMLGLAKGHQNIAAIYEQREKEIIDQLTENMKIHLNSVSDAMGHLVKKLKSDIHIMLFELDNMSVAKKSKDE